MAATKQKTKKRPGSRADEKATPAHVARGEDPIPRKQRYLSSREMDVERAERIHSDIYGAVTAAQSRARQAIQLAEQEIDPKERERWQREAEHMKALVDQDQHLRRFADLLRDAFTQTAKHAERLMLRVVPDTSDIRERWFYACVGSLAALLSDPSPSDLHKVKEGLARVDVLAWNLTDEALCSIAKKCLADWRRDPRQEPFLWFPARVACACCAIEYGAGDEASAKDLFLRRGFLNRPQVVDGQQRFRLLFGTGQ